MSDTTKSIRGVLPVFQTPYHEDESIDFETLTREIDWLFEQGANGIVLAMVSEVLRLASDERDQLAEYVCKAANGRGAVIISVGAESSHTAERHAWHAQSVGAGGLMAIPPVSIAATEAELRDYYSRLIRSVDIPVIVQDASGYVGKPMSIEFQAGLMNEYGPERVMFKPEAPPIGPRLTELHEATGNRASVFEGTGGVALLDSYQRGVAGTIPGADLIKAIVPLWKALEDGDAATAERIHKPLAELISIQTSLDGFLTVEKHLLVRQGIFKNEIVRGPRAFQLDDATRGRVNLLFDQLMETCN